jgi:hypothetical protein
VCGHALQVRRSLERCGAGGGEAARAARRRERIVERPARSQLLVEIAENVRFE